MPFTPSSNTKKGRRKLPEYQGGFLLDGGVHFVAALQYLLQAVGENVVNVASFTNLLEKKLAPVDTVHAILKLRSDRSGSFNVSFGTQFKGGFEIEVVTKNGCCTVGPTEVTCVHLDATGEKAEKKESFEFGAGVKKEVEAFAQSIRDGKSDERATPEQALADLELLEALLRSGEEGGKLYKL